jgi:sugar phosphate isomerase/epimerase
MTTPTRDLVLSHFSLGRYVDFEQRVAAAAEAGYVGIGLWYGDYLRMRADGRTDAELRAILDHHGLRVTEYEALRGWASSGDELATSREHETTLYRMADALGPGGSFQVLGPHPGPVERAAEALAAVCDRAARHGLRATIEYLPEMTNIPDAASAWRLAQLADRPNAGLCVDSWHHFRGANDLAMLAAVPASRIFTVQINDGPAARVHADYYRDCTETRLPPGEGSFDLASFVRTLDGMGVRIPFSVEVLSTDLLARETPAGIAALLASRTRELLARVDARPAR